MLFARVISAASACVLLGAAVAACSGSLGSGTSGPVPLGSLGPNASPTSVSTASSSTVVLTYGESTAFQNLPQVAGYSGAVAFPLPSSPTPNPKSSAMAALEPVAIGATLSVVKPEDGPDLNFAGGKGKARKSRELPARALAYVKLLPTHDLVLTSYPRIALDIPRDLAAQYRDGEFGLALWNSGTKDSAYRLAAAERDVTSSPPPSANASVAPSASPSPSPSPSASPSPSVTARASGAPRPAAPSATPTLPPQRIVFAGTAATLKLVANRPVIFALYALPHPSAASSPAAAKAASRAPAATATAKSTGTPGASPSPTASVSSAPATTASPKSS
jgi:hypothetical protein